MIVASCGGKGGVGKSTVSLNLARRLDAVVVDADLTAPDLPRGRGPDLHDVLAGRASPLDAIEQVGSVSVLPCRRSLASARAADLSDLQSVVEQLDRQRANVVIDCPAGLARDVGYQLDSADAAVVVTTPKPAALLSAVRTRRLALSIETPVPCIAVNKAQTEEDGRIADRLEDKLGTPTMVIPRCEAFADSIDAGTPVAEYAADSPGVDAVDALAASLERCERQLTGRAGST